MSAVSQAAGDYLRLRHRLGHQLVQAVWLLPRFVAYLDAAGTPTVTVEAALAWSTQADPGTNMGDLLRHGGMGRLFTGIRAPSTLGIFLRTFTFGHVRQLDAVAARFLTCLSRHAPMLPGAGQVCYVDIDDTLKATHGYQKQGAG